MPNINRYLANLNPSSSKAISQAAKENPSILNLSIGEPDFGPPAHLLDEIAREDLQLPPFIDAVKRYEHSRGAPQLRQAIAQWYRRRYDMVIDPETEIIVTHGGIEALNLALLAVTDPGDIVAIADPSYTLYQRAICVLGRATQALVRPAALHEYDAALQTSTLDGVKALLLNSPENPTGYVISDADWQAVAQQAERADCWVIHDEVYDTMAFLRPHCSARSVPGLGPRSLLVNSCSKKFGMPGLRVGWLIGPPQVIAAATKVHESLCLGVNILAERIATRVVQNATMEAWMATQRTDLAGRNEHAMAMLTEQCGYVWPRAPMGGMFLFPDVQKLYARLPASSRAAQPDVGTAVATYLLQELKIATVPGGLYGQYSRNHIRITNCGPAAVFSAAIARLAA